MATTLTENIVKAHKRIKPHVRHTPLEYSPWLSEAGKATVYIKLESEQCTGSFKVRGAFNKLLTMQESSKQDLACGTVVASTGNHGIACALAMKTIKAQGTIVVPANISSTKLRGLKEYGAVLEFHGQDCVEAEARARQMAQEKKMTYISPYNDWDVIAGQGTVGVEILEDFPEVDAVFVCVGGGGLIAGIASYLKSFRSSVEIIGCQPENSAVMAASVKEGRILDLSSNDTLSDGSAGGLESGSVTFDLCRSFVDKWVLVSEDEIECAVYDMMEKHHKIVEGAAGVALAAYLKERDRLTGKNVAIVACGANISIDSLKRIIHICS